VSPRAGRCPSCGEPVSAFAAGCAICGTDLEAHRRAQASRRVPRVALPAFPFLGSDAALVAILVILAIFQPILCLLFGGFVAYRLDQDGRVTLRNVALAIDACALALLFVPSVRFGIWQLLLG